MSPKRRQKGAFSSQEKPSITQGVRKNTSKQPKNTGHRRKGDGKSQALNGQGRATEQRQIDGDPKESIALLNKDHSTITPMKKKDPDDITLTPALTEAQLIPDQQFAMNRQSLTQVSQSNYLKAYLPTQGHQNSTLSKFKMRNRERYLANRHIPSQCNL